MYDKLPDILLVVSESPLAWSAFVIFVIISFITKLQLGKTEKLAREIKNLPLGDRIKAIERLYSDVPRHSPESFLRAKRQNFRFAYYLSTLFFILAITYLLLFYSNKIIHSLLPFMPPPVEIVKEPPESGTVNSNTQGYVNFQRVFINLERCEKESTSSVSCKFKVENKSGDRDFALLTRGSQIIEKSGDRLLCNSVQISNEDSSSYSSRIKLISGIPTSAIYNFGGVAENVNSIAALEAVVETEGERLTLQYKNVSLQ